MFDLSGQVCYVRVKLEMLHEHIKLNDGNVDLDSVEKTLWSAETYINTVRKHIKEENKE
jgi:hemerythrin-like domain-containing protein